MDLGRRYRVYNFWKRASGCFEGPFPVDSPPARSKWKSNSHTLRANPKHYHSTKRSHSLQFVVADLIISAPYSFPPTNCPPPVQRPCKFLIGWLLSLHLSFAQPLKEAGKEFLQRLIEPHAPIDDLLQGFRVDPGRRLPLVCRILVSKSRELPLTPYN